MTLEQACNLFGGKQTLRKILINTIRAERLTRNISPQELYSEALLESQGYPTDIIDEIEQGKRYIDGELATSVMAPLGISLNDVMILPKLTEQQELYWTTKYLASGDGPVHASKINKEGEVLDFKGELDDTIQLGLFIRFAALDELNTP